MSDGSQQVVSELVNVEPVEVSMVGRPANKRKFLIVKNAEGKMAKGTELNVNAEGVLETSGEPAAVETPAVQKTAEVPVTPETPAEAPVVAAKTAPTLDEALKAITDALSDRDNLTLGQVEQLKGLAVEVAKFETAPVEKAETAETPSKVEKELEDLKLIVKSQSDEIKRLKGTRPDSNAGGAGEGDLNTKAPLLWPNNFNDPEQPEEDIFR